MDSIGQIRDSIKHVQNNDIGYSYQSGFVLMLGIGVIFFIIGVVIYYCFIWRNHKQVFPTNKNFFKSLSYVASYTPNKGPLFHVLGGVFITIGFGIFFGYGISIIINSQNLSFHSSAVTISSLFFTLITSLITFWTLNQTKRIEHEQGHKVIEFSTLISRLYNNLNDLKRSIHSRKKVGESYFRVYIVTEHPFFGIMSHPDYVDTINLREILVTLNNIKDEGKEFEFEILCGNESCIRGFIENYYSSIKDESLRKNKIQKAVEEFERQIKKINYPGCVTRVNSLPSFPQFVIIGNTLFEFIIEAKSPQTKIVETNIISDPKRCNIYIETFKLLKNHLSKNNNP